MIERIIPVVREASALMVRTGFQVMEKGSSVNVVTSSDLAVQHFLVDRLSEILPGSGFLCEEDDLNDVSHEYIWIIDPIDGTANYARGIQNCCISVALARKGGLVAGVVYSPWKDELYSAEIGCGSFMNGRPISVSGRPLKDSIICTAMSAYRKEFARTCSDIIYDIYMRSNDFRRYGSAADELCMLAAGQVDLFFEMRLHPWDYAAASLIITEAGGCSCGFDGKPLNLFKPGMVIAANGPENLSEILSTVHKYMAELPY